MPAGHARDQAAGDELRPALLPRRHRRGLRRRGPARPGPDPRRGAAPDGRAAARSPACRATSTSTTPATTGCRAASPSNTRSGSGWCCSACSGSGCRSRSAAPRVFFRRNALEEIGAWDAHNVTEDADLGMRLARFGYRCEMIATTTWRRRTAGVRPLDPPALALAQGLRDHLGHAHAPAGARSGATSGRGLPRLPGALSRRASPRIWRCRCSGCSGPGRSASTSPFWQHLAGLADVALLRLDDRSGQAVMLTTAADRARATAGGRGCCPGCWRSPLYWPLGAVAAWRAVARDLLRALLLAQDRARRRAAADALAVSSRA